MTDISSGTAATAIMTTISFVLMLFQNPTFSSLPVSISPLSPVYAAGYRY